MGNRALWSAVGATLLVSPIALADVGEADFSLGSTQNLYDLCSCLLYTSDAADDTSEV